MPLCETALDFLKNDWMHDTKILQKTRGTVSNLEKNGSKWQEKITDAWIITPEYNGILIWNQHYKRKSSFQ